MSKTSLSLETILRKQYKSQQSAVDRLWQQMLRNSRDIKSLYAERQSLNLQVQELIDVNRGVVIRCKHGDARYVIDSIIPKNAINIDKKHIPERFSSGRYAGFDVKIMAYLIKKNGKLSHRKIEISTFESYIVEHKNYEELKNEYK